MYHLPLSEKLYLRNDYGHQLQKEPVNISGFIRNSQNKDYHIRTSKQRILNNHTGRWNNPQLFLYPKKPLFKPTHDGIFSKIQDRKQTRKNIHRLGKNTFNNIRTFKGNLYIDQINNGINSQTSAGNISNYRNMQALKSSFKDRKHVYFKRYKQGAIKGRMLGGEKAKATTGINRDTKYENYKEPLTTPKKFKTGERKKKKATLEKIKDFLEPQKFTKMFTHFRIRNFGQRSDKNNFIDTKDYPKEYYINFKNHIKPYEKHQKPIRGFSKSKRDNPINKRMYQKENKNKSNQLQPRITQYKKENLIPSRFKRKELLRKNHKSKHQKIINKYKQENLRNGRFIKRPLERNYKHKIDIKYSKKPQKPKFYNLKTKSEKGQLIRPKKQYPRKLTEKYTYFNTGSKNKYKSIPKKFKPINPEKKTFRPKLKFRF